MPDDHAVSKNQIDAPASDGASLPAGKTSTASDIAAFVAKARALEPQAGGASGRLVFSLDATMSRQPTWDMACRLQADMFREAGSIGGLDVRLVYFRGLSECRASPWISDTGELARLMTRISVEGGHTQIGRVLSETRREAVKEGVRALVFVGDAMEENLDDLCVKAGELGLFESAVFHVSGRRRSGRRKCVSRDRKAVGRRLVPVRSGCGGATARIAAGGGGLCRGRARGAGAAVEDGARCFRAAHAIKMRSMR